jgi:hypothetical protein
MQDLAFVPGLMVDYSTSTRGRGRDEVEP